MVDAAALVGGGDHPATRYISVKVDLEPPRRENAQNGAAGGRQGAVMFAVTSVQGVRDIATDSLHDLSPLLGAVNSDMVAALGVIGTEPLLLLRGARLLPDLVRAAVGADRVDR